MQYTDKKEVEDIQYITFLLMARAGLRALEFYDPTTKKHGQAHMQARYVSDPDESQSFANALSPINTTQSSPALVSPNTLSTLALPDWRKYGTRVASWRTSSFAYV